MSSEDRIEPLLLDNKFGSMLLLSGVVTIMIISCIDSPPIHFDAHLEFRRFFTVWVAILCLAMAWSFFLEIHPPLLSIMNCLEILWSTSLMAALFIFLNHYPQITNNSKTIWGEVAGPLLVGIFFSSWVFIVFNYHLGRTHDMVDFE
ncbi:unnamed protein product [Allacma fusca]|uniref:Uncharacterized protein n=1 Tax=Allacma fusca TaxID=39272 RepID=A0A8J2PR62_9HEXA|nr:unnamed protein product [Allacma fusca]